MREIDAGLAAHIAGGVTTLARCWRIARGDGVVLGFTDHDRTLSFEGTDYEPATGFDAGEDVSATGFAVGGQEVSGALSSDRLDAADLAAGRYDNAEVRAYLVNWTTPTERHLLRVGHLGEVVREDGAFRAEVRGLAARLDEAKGRAFRPSCDADLGDARCGVDLDDPDFTATGAVTAVHDRRRFVASGLASYAAGWFDRGYFVWTDGDNAGAAFEVRSHRLVGGTVEVELWQPAFHDIAPGDGFTISAGCDKRFETCRKKFDNTVNFRGFPHMPGNDFTLAYAKQGDKNNGKAVVE
ncbi:MAG: DUF2163 domain-containing protein [Bauldia sp.]|uniref:DUF2163 domain-containing protein n=1 Tax=Bauldia sp. TaxID=2575872 RepID=UPI001D8E02A5|nr:DUF2163 domain-containing protein [Bauldia sp.]MCB1494161.1 DUF2163 domain-containing protein [Bauldia sp.]